MMFGVNILIRRVRTCEFNTKMLILFKHFPEKKKRLVEACYHGAIKSYRYLKIHLPIPTGTRKPVPTDVTPVGLSGSARNSKPTGTVQYLLR